MEEARYLCGILNSEALRSGVEQYQAQGQWGARHFDKYVFNLPIPRFNALTVRFTVNSLKWRKRRKRLQTPSK